MLWIVEGCDRTGKTSLCESLAHLFDGEVLHFDKPEQGAIDEYVTPLLEYEPGGPAKRNLFVDRHFLGEAVWPQFFGRPSRMTETERYCIELFLKSKGALCVLCVRDPEDLEAACIAQDEPTAHRATEAQDLFFDAVSPYYKEDNGSRWRPNPLRLLTWRSYEHGHDVTPLIDKARELEKEAS